MSQQRTRVEDFSNRQIGDFIVHERIGRGALSVVYRAVQQSVNRSVSLKIINLNANPLAQENYQPYFMQEAKILAKLEHIHIVPIYNYGVVDSESSYIAMRLLRGGTVSDLIHAGVVDVERAVDIFTQVAQGLAHAHQQGIIHRDLKPTNILLDDLGNAYLSDFGLGKLAEVSLDLTESGSVIGTPFYASPEQLGGDEISTRSDIYSMAAIFYQMVAGRPPYTLDKGGFASFIRQHESPPPSLHSLDPGITLEVNAIVQKALSRNPDDRYETIQEMADALSMALGRRISRSSAPVVYVTTPALAKRRFPILLAVLVSVLLVLAALIAYSTARSTPAGQARVLSGEIGNSVDAVPSPAELDAARARLGTSGFIAYIACTLDTEFQASRARVMAERAAAYGVAFRVYDSGMDRYRQLTTLERARLEGASAIILCALDSSSLNAALADLQTDGVPLVFNTGYNALFGGVMIDAGDYELGYQAGSYAGQIIRLERDGEANVVILQFPQLALSDARVEGMLAGLRDIAPDAVVVRQLEGITPENGAQAVERLLADNIDFDVILSVNDGAAIGAISALEAANVPETSVDIVSINGEDQAKLFIDAGHYLRGTVQMDRETSSTMALDAVVRLLGGATIPETLTYGAGELYTADVLSTPEPAAE